jgi:hypothetical protein
MGNESADNHLTDTERSSGLLHRDPQPLIWWWTGRKAACSRWPRYWLISSFTLPSKAAKEGRLEGNIIRSSKDQSTLTVRKRGLVTAEVTVQYDSSTKWVSQFHGDKKVNDIDASQVKDGDRVICRGTWEKNVLHATLISKRLSH